MTCEVCCSGSSLFEQPLHQLGGGDRGLCEAHRAAEGRFCSRLTVPPPRQSRSGGQIGWQLLASQRTPSHCRR